MGIENLIVGLLLLGAVAYIVLKFRLSFKKKDQNCENACCEAEHKKTPKTEQI